MHLHLLLFLSLNHTSICICPNNLQILAPQFFTIFFWLSQFLIHSSHLFYSCVSSCYELLSPWEQCSFGYSCYCLTCGGKYLFSVFQKIRGEGERGCEGKRYGCHVGLSKRQCECFLYLISFLKPSNNNRHDKSLLVLQ